MEQQQKSDDETSSNNRGLEQGKETLTARQHPRSVANNTLYADLVHAGFRPPQSFHPDRAAIRRRSQYEEDSSVDDHHDDDVDDDRRQRTRHTSAASISKSTDIVDSDQDTKPRAIPTTEPVKSKEFSPAVVLHRQQSNDATTQKRPRGTTNRTKKDKSSPNEHEPLHLFHRLFEPIEGRKNRKRIITVDPNDNKNTKIAANKHLKPKGSANTATSTNLKDSNKDRNVTDTSNTPSIAIETPVVVDVPPSAIIRGSITHKILQKLNRLDTKLLYDDPFNSKRSENDKMINNNNNNDDSNDNYEKIALIPVGESASNWEEKQEPSTTKKDNGDVSTVVEKNGVGIENSGQTFAQASKSVCIRSTVIPQMNMKSFPPKIRVVILYGVHRGRTGK
jgi:hypothetical protein